MSLSAAQTDGPVNSCQKDGMFAELLLHVIHRLISTGELLHPETLPEEVELDHGVCFQFEEHDPRRPIRLLRTEQLRESWFYGFDDLMRKGGRAREAHGETVDTELLGLEEEYGPLGGQLMAAGFDARIFDILGELGKDEGASS